MSDLVSFTQALARSKPVCVPPNNSIVELLSTDDVVIDGVQVKQASYVCDDSGHRFDGLKASDFALENLIAAGVDLKMTFCRPNSLGAVSSMEYELQKMLDYSSNEMAKRSVHVENVNPQNS